MVGQEFTTYLPPVADADLGIRAAGDHGPGGEDAGEQRLADALAGQCVGGGSGVPGKENRAVFEHRPVDAGGDGPGRAPALGLGTGSEHVAYDRTGEQAVPDMAGVADGHPATTQHAEADVGAIPGKRETPRVAGQQVGLEPDVEVAACRAHVGHVLAEGLPLAPVAVLRQPEEPTGRRPHTVRCDHHGRPDRVGLGDLQFCAAFVDVDAGHCVALPHLCT